MAGNILPLHPTKMNDVPAREGAPPPIDSLRVPPFGGATGREGLPGTLPQHLPHAPHPQITWA